MSSTPMFVFYVYTSPLSSTWRDRPHGPRQFLSSPLLTPPKCLLGKICFVQHLATHARRSLEPSCSSTRLAGLYPMIFLILFVCRGRSITTAPLVEFAQRHVSKGLNHLTEDVIVEGEGPWVTMHSGRKLLDFTSGIGVTNLGTFE